jgi:hypothetical protein
VSGGTTGGSSVSSSKVHVAVKSSKDARYSSHWVVSHDGRCMRCYTADSLAQFKLALGPAWAKLQVLAIDEAQFFPDLLEFCQAAVDRDGKHVIVAGLAGEGWWCSRALCVDAHRPRAVPLTPSPPVPARACLPACR